MTITRRKVALLVGAAALLPNASARAESADETALVEAVERLRKAMVEADKARLEELTAEHLSYGHSGGRVQNKAEFVAEIADRQTIYKSIILSDAMVAIAGHNGVARHVFAGETESGGKPGSAHIGVLQVWVKDAEGRWKLLARQGFKL